MEEEVDESTNFTIIFPQVLPKDLTKCLDCEERQFAVVGESIDIILVAKYARDGSEAPKISKWATYVKTLYTLGGVSTDAGKKSDVHSFSVGNGDIKPDTPNKGEFVCRPFASYRERLRKHDPPTSPMERNWFEVDSVTLVHPLRLPLDNLPADSTQCQVSVAVWSPPKTSPELKDLEILEAFLKYNPEDVLKQHGKIVRQIVSASLLLLNPPGLTCRHVFVGGKSHIFLKVINTFRDLLSVHSVRVLPNNDGYLASSAEPETESEGTSSSRGDRSEVDGNSLLKVESSSLDLPLTLQYQESHCTVFTLTLREAATFNLEGEDVHLMAALTWSQETTSLQVQNIITQYRLPSLKMRKPGLIITAVPDQQPELNRSFNVQYTITNNLQDFLSLKLVWSPEKALKDPKAAGNEDYRRSIENVMNSVICHHPSSPLGSCKLGATIAVCIGFQILREGVFELGQHMKLNLQYAIGPPPTGQKRGSITSTHSMPMESHREYSSPQHQLKSAPMSPIHTQPEGRRGSTTSARSFASAPTPTESSPVHNAKSSSYGDLLGIPPGGTRQQSVPPTSYRSVSATSSPVKPPPVSTGIITSQQVLKRNCQVYVPGQS